MSSYEENYNIFLDKKGNGVSMETYLNTIGKSE